MTTPIPPRPVVTFAHAKQADGTKSYQVVLRNVSDVALSLLDKLDLSRIQQMEVFENEGMEGRYSVVIDCPDSESQYAVTAELQKEIDLEVQGPQPGFLKERALMSSWKTLFKSLKNPNFSFERENYAQLLASLYQFPKPHSASTARMIKLCESRIKSGKPASMRDRIELLGLFVKSIQPIVSKMPTAQGVIFHEMKEVPGLIEDRYQSTVFGANLKKPALAAVKEFLQRPPEAGTRLRAITQDPRAQASYAMQIGCQLLEHNYDSTRDPSVPSIVYRDLPRVTPDFNIQFFRRDGTVLKIEPYKEGSEEYKAQEARIEKVCREGVLGQSAMVAWTQGPDLALDRFVTGVYCRLAPQVHTPETGCEKKFQKTVAIREEADGSLSVRETYHWQVGLVDLPPIGEERPDELPLKETFLAGVTHCSYRVSLQDGIGVVSDMKVDASTNVLSGDEKVKAAVEGALQDYESFILSPPTRRKV